MLDKLFGGDRYLATTHALDATVLRHQVIAHNLANVNTPGFKRQEVNFEAQLAKALAQRDNPCTATLCPPISGLQPSVVTINTTSERADGNNVNMEMENVNLAINTLRFEVLSQSLGGYFGGLKTVINGR